MKTTHKAATLVEILVVIAIIGLLIALLLPAIQPIRSTATRMQSCNNLRQIGIALHHFDEVKGRLPGVNNVLVPTVVRQDYVSSNNVDGDENADRSPLWVLVPYLDGAPQGEPFWKTVQTVKVFVSPGDPTSQFEPVWQQASYGINMTALEKRPSLSNGFPDGLSNTIAATERYYHSYMDSKDTPADNRQEVFARFTTMMPGDKSSNYRTDERRASFADRGYYGEVFPITRIVNGVPVTTPSVPGQTFQVRPSPDDAWSAVPQTPFASGLPTLLFDGSVRTISPGISTRVFWAAVTRDGGEVLTDW